jgi:hypothetical protein
MTLPDGLRARLDELYPGARVVRVIALRDDESGDDEMKALGYGRPLRVELQWPKGARCGVVFHTLRPDDFGHDRRADRVGNLVLAYDTFGKLPHHVHAIDVGLVRKDGALVSLATTEEPYLLTSWAEGTLYAEELRNAEGTESEIAHAEALARLLLEIHAQPGSHPGAYTRAIRDLLGHGEGIFGLVDSYDGDVVPAARLRAIEEACVAWRWKLRDQTHRLRRTHGDFHPFNIVFGSHDDQPILLDASRGSEGDPADDVACLAVNYIFFRARPLWDAFWRTYLAADPVDVCAAVAPFFAWRVLVLASPRWYPHLAASDRERILSFAERVLAAERFDPGMYPP